MKKNIETQLDDRFAEIGFPDYDDPALPHAMRCELAKCVGQFYGGAIMVVDRRDGKLKIYTRP